MSKFEEPLGLVKAPGLPGWIFVVEQRGRIYRVEDKPSSTKKQLFVDLSLVVSQSNSETGLLGLAFHPDFQKNGKFYLSYTTGEDSRVISHIAQFAASDPANPRLQNTKPNELLRLAQPWSNHNGGAICFGPDGYLYFSLGDGGSGGDPKNNGQNLRVLFGKIHRIDVNKTDAGKKYSIPKDNPFVHTKNARPEIYAYGLRNVWQMHFDPETKELWAGDVGQNAWEEIDRIKKGKNYGWRIKEGNNDFDENQPWPMPVLEPPMFSYSQGNGDKSVTGGLIYRGSKSSRRGKYIYGDFMSGRIWAFDPVKKTNLFITQSESISCFGENANRELLFASHGQGVIYELK